MILPKHIRAYERSGTSPETSRTEVEKFLLKFNVKTFMWNRDTPEKSYLLFKYKSKYMPEPIAYKVTIPFIEKKNNIYDETRSYRFFWHIFKNCMLMGEIGMETEQIFRDFLVIGTHEDGTPMNLGEKHDQALVAGELKALTSTI